jgi:hypothetical protein
MAQGALDIDWLNSRVTRAARRVVSALSPSFRLRDYCNRVPAITVSGQRSCCMDAGPPLSGMGHRPTYQLRRRMPEWRGGRRYRRRATR